MEAKSPGEDYMGDIYEGYIPGALDDLHSDGIYCKYIYYLLWYPSLKISYYMDESDLVNDAELLMIVILADSSDQRTSVETSSPSSETT